MSDKVWKAFERAIADYFGGERVPITGRQRGSAPDVEHPLLAFELKYKQKLPLWIHDAYAQAVASVRKDKIPVVVFKQKQQRIRDSYVLMRASDLKKLLEKIDETT